MSCLPSAFSMENTMKRSSRLLSIAMNLKINKQQKLIVCTHILSTLYSQCILKTKLFSRSLCQNSPWFSDLCLQNLRKILWSSRKSPAFMLYLISSLYKSFDLVFISCPDYVIQFTYVQFIKSLVPRLH